MTTVILGLLAYAGLVYLALVLVGANDRAVPDVTSFDLTLWAIEHEGAS
jgi:hypothetical protein